MVTRLRKSFLLGRKARQIVHEVGLAERARFNQLTPEQRAAESAQADQIISNVNTIAADRRDQRQVSGDVEIEPIGPGSNL